MVNLEWLKEGIISASKSVGKKWKRLWRMKKGIQCLAGPIVRSWSAPYVTGQLSGPAPETGVFAQCHSPGQVSAVGELLYSTQT